jgi:hypothetical protein
VIFVDAHVHFHNTYHPAAFLNAAYRNIENIARSSKNNDRWIGVLCFTTGEKEAGSDLWQSGYSLQERKNSKHGNWHIQATEEDVSVRAIQHDKELFLIAGRQIVSHERIEILAIGTRHQFEEGKPLEVLLEEVSDHEAIPVIPWGVGRWMGKRGRILKETILHHASRKLFLGDNSNRPQFWPKPILLKEAENHGFKNLPGSDPLPFPGEYRKPGSYGFALNGSLEPEQPFKSLKEKLFDPAVEIWHYGALEKPLRFFRHQLAMQYRKHLKRPYTVDL